jgi:hypothetical protein
MRRLSGLVVQGKAVIFSCHFTMKLATIVFSYSFGRKN